MTPAPDTAASLPCTPPARRFSGPRARAWLAALLLVLVGMQWLAVAHRTVHGEGPTAWRADSPRAVGRHATGIEAVARAGTATSVVALLRAIDDHPAAGADCRRFDSLLGHAPAPGDAPSSSIVACLATPPGGVVETLVLGLPVRAPPARGPPDLLA